MNTTADPTAEAASGRTRTTPAGTSGRHLVLRHRLSVDGWGVPIIGGGFFLAVLLLTGIVSAFTDVRISGWEVGTQVIRWFVGAIGVYLTAVYLPLYVTHGRTRRDVAVDTASFGGIYAVLVAVLVAVGFAMEAFVYRVAGWTQGLDGDHLFDDVGQYHLVLIESVAVLAVWVAAGAMLGAAFYRHGGLGLVLLPVGLAPVMFIEMATGPGYFGPLPPPLLETVGLGFESFAPLAVVAAAAACYLVLAAVTWRIVRDVPIRPQSS